VSVQAFACERAARRAHSLFSERRGGRAQRDELRAKYRLVEPEGARAGWAEVYESSLRACMHGVNCTQGADCQARPA
jgi:hypothetical protein